MVSVATERIKETLTDELKQPILDYFVKFMTLSEVCDIIRKHINVSDKQEKTIGLILDKYKTKWCTIPFKINTATKKQMKVLDDVSDDCIKEIVDQFSLKNIPLDLSVLRVIK